MSGFEMEWDEQRDTAVFWRGSSDQRVEIEMDEAQMWALAKVLGVAPNVLYDSPYIGGGLMARGVQPYGHLRSARPAPLRRLPVHGPALPTFWQRVRWRGVVSVCPTQSLFAGVAVVENDQEAK